MKRLAIILLIIPFLLVSAVSFADEYVVKEKTPVTLKLLNTLKSGKTPVGEVVQVELQNEVLGEDGTVLVKKYANGYGHVTLSKRNGMFGNAGKLEFTLDYLEGIDGSRIPLRSSIENAGDGCTGTVIFSTLFLSVAAVFFRGENVVVPAGTLFNAFVDKDSTINIKRTEYVSGPSASVSQSGGMLDTGQIKYQKKGNELHMFFLNKDVVLNEQEHQTLKQMFAKALSSFQDAESRKMNIANAYIGAISENFKMYFWSMNNAETTFAEIKYKEDDIKLSKREVLNTINALEQM